MRRIILFGILGLMSLTLGTAHGASITLVDGIPLEGTIISRLESQSGEYLITVSIPEQQRLYQYYASEVDGIKSLTPDNRLLAAPTSLRSGPSDDSSVVIRFGPGMELSLGERRDGWVHVTPISRGLASNAGWVREEALTDEINMRGWIADQKRLQESESAPVEEIVPEGASN